MSAPAVVALRRQGAPDLLVAYAEAVERQPIGPDARRIRRAAAARLLAVHPDLEAWMARPTPARLADLRRSGAWPFLSWCFLEGHLRPDLDLLLAKSPGDLYATWAQRRGHDVARLTEVAGRFGWSANWTRDLTAGLAMICLWAGTDLDGLAGAVFERFATELTSCPSAGRDARAHNGARAYSLHQVCYELRVCDCPPRKNMRRAATLAEALAAIPQPSLIEGAHVRNGHRGARNPGLMARSEADALHDGLKASFAVLFDHIEDARLDDGAGYRVVICPRLPVPGLHGIWIDGPDESADLEGLQAAVAKLEGVGLPCWVEACTGRTPVMEAVARGLGFTEGSPIPGMILRPDQLAVVPGPELEFACVRDAAGLDVAATVAAAGFEAPREMIGALLTPAMGTAPGVSVYVAYADGEPVSTATAWLGDGGVGIYSVATPPNSGAVATGERSRRRRSRTASRPGPRSPGSRPVRSASPSIGRWASGWWRHPDPRSARGGVTAEAH